MPDLESILKAAPISQQQRADLWDAYQKAGTPDELASVLQPLQIPNDVKAGLWDLNSASRPRAVAPTDTPMAGVGAAVRGTLSGWNPVNAVAGAAEMVNAPVATLRQTGSPVAALSTLTHGQANERMAREGLAAFHQGDYLTAGRKGLSYMANAIPGLGEALDAAADKIKAGNIHEGMGDAIGLGLSFWGPAIWGKVARAVPKSVRIPGMSGPANPAEAAAVKAGQAEGVEIPANVATGNRAVGAVQWMADRSLAGAGVAKAAEQRTAQGMTDYARRLAARAHPEAQTMETAGTAVEKAGRETLGAVGEQASEAYQRLRELQGTAEPVRSEAVPKFGREQASNAIKTLGQAPDMATLSELQRMRTELAEYGYQKGKLVNDALAGGEMGESHYAKGHAGAPVYDDILQAAGQQASRARVLAAIDAALESGYFTPIAKGAVKVAEARLVPGSEAARSAMLPPSAGMAAQEIRLPVELKGAKADLKPLYEDLQKTNRLVGLEGAEAKAFVALDDFMKGPDTLPLMEADKIASQLKKLSRNEKYPEARTAGSAFAAKGVGGVEGAIQKALDTFPPEVRSALEEGRSGTKAKYGIRDILDRLKTDPEDTARSLVSAGDANITPLRQIREVAPVEIPKIGRAWMDDRITKATQEGGFEHMKRLAADWFGMGPETKRILYGPELTADYNHFFVLAKKLGEQSNPSGTAHNLAAAGQMAALVNPATMLLALKSEIGAYALSRLFHSPAGVRMLTRQLSLSLGGASASTRAATMANVIRFARKAQMTEGYRPALAAVAAERSEEKR
jgi:hypothetical protein